MLNIVHHHHQQHHSLRFSIQTDNIALEKAYVLIIALYREPAENQNSVLLSPISLGCNGRERLKYHANLLRQSHQLHSRFCKYHHDKKPTIGDNEITSVRAQGYVYMVLCRVSLSVVLSGQRMIKLYISSTQVTMIL